jgi:hypothetical protein
LSEQLIKLLGQNFVQRKDVKAFQRSDGSWFPVRAGKDGPFLPMRRSDFENHLKGTQTLGHYMVEPETNLCKLFAFDIDLTKPVFEPEDKVFRPTYRDENNVERDTWINDGIEVPFNPREVWQVGNPAATFRKLLDPAAKHLTLCLRSMAEALSSRIYSVLNIPTAILNSGNKGLHVYGFTGSIPADTAREMAISILDSFGVFKPYRGNNFYRHTHAYNCLEIEVFPKQSTVSADGFGNLMRLPLGVNMKSHNKSYFVSCKCGGDRLDLEMTPIRALEGNLPWE